MLMWGKWRIYDRQKFEEGKTKAPRRSKLRVAILTKASGRIDEDVFDDVRQDSRARLMIFTKDKVAVHFNGPILKFFFENPANLEPIAKLGPDPLRPNFDINDLKDRLYQRIKNNSSTLIVDLLLDQTFVAGIGNKYKSEILFLSNKSICCYQRYSIKSNENIIAANSICTQYWICQCWNDKSNI